MTQDDRQEGALHHSLRPVLRLELAQRVLPLGPEYQMYLDELNRSTRIFVDGTPKGVTC